MIIIQICDGLECHGEVVAKGRTRETAFKNFQKEYSDYWDKDCYGTGQLPVVTYDWHYIYIDGTAEYNFAEI